MDRTYGKTVKVSVRPIAVKVEAQDGTIHISEMMGNYQLTINKEKNGEKIQEAVLLDHRTALDLAEALREFVEFF